MIAPTKPATTIFAARSGPRAVGSARLRALPVTVALAAVIASSTASAQEASERQEFESAVEALEAARLEMERTRLELEEAQAQRELELQTLRAELEDLRSSEGGRRGKRDRSRGDDPRGDFDEGPGERVAFGDVVRVAAGEAVSEVVAFGDDVRVEGVVEGDATSLGGDVYVADGGVVEGDAISFGGRVYVADGGVVEGDRLAMPVPGVAIDEEDEYVEEPDGADEGRGLEDAVGSVGGLTGGEILATAYRRLILLLSFAGAGVLVVGLFPKRVGRIAAAVEDRPIRAAVVGGLGTTFLAIFSVLFTLMTFGLGLPVSLVVVGMLGLAWLLGFVGLCQAVGDRLPFEQKPHGRWVAFLVGTILVTCIGSLPLVGWLVVGAASMVGMGAALSTRFGGR